MVVPGDSYETTVKKDAAGKLGFTIRREFIDGGAALIVSSVISDGPAFAAGVAQGSFLLEVNGQAVTHRGDDPFAVLGLDREAEPADIKRAWREKVLHMHPDKGGDSSAWLKLQTAFKILKDEKLRGHHKSIRRIGATADWDLAVKLMRLSDSGVTLKLHLPAVRYSPSSAPGVAAVDFDDAATDSPPSRDVDVDVDDVDRVVTRAPSPPPPPPSPSPEGPTSTRVDADARIDDDDDDAVDDLRIRGPSLDADLDFGWDAAGDDAPDSDDDDHGVVSPYDVGGGLQEDCNNDLLASVASLGCVSLALNRATQLLEGASLGLQHEWSG